MVQWKTKTYTIRASKSYRVYCFNFSDTMPDEKLKVTDAGLKSIVKYQKFRLVYFIIELIIF